MVINDGSNILIKPGLKHSKLITLRINLWGELLVKGWEAEREKKKDVQESTLCFLSGAQIITHHL